MNKILISGTGERLICEEHQLLDMKRNKDGTFKRIHHRFSLDNFDDGYIDHHGRMRVWVPKHPKATRMGYVKRAVIAYETYHGISIPPNMDIHHIDGNRLNDTKENLFMVFHAEHSRATNSKKESNVPRICEHCGKEFTIKRWKLKDMSGGTKRRGRFCSQKCFHSHKRSESHKENISLGLKRAYAEGRR